jgi:HEAT repeat protein
MQTAETVIRRLREAALEFQEWAEGLTADERSAEWETDYEKWPELTRVYCDVLDVCRPDDWDQSLVDLLLYILARDNEVEVLKGELISRPTQLIALAAASPASDEPDAKWQIADALGRVGATHDAEPIIKQLLQDRDEYVSRRALLALARRGAENLDVWAVRAWETGQEYQRMAALEAFAMSRSPLLASYLDQAENDGRQFLVRRALELRDGRA